MSNGSRRFHVRKCQMLALFVFAGARGLFGTGNISGLSLILLLLFINSRINRQNPPNQAKKEGEKRPTEGCSKSHLITNRCCCCCDLSSRFLFLRLRLSVVTRGAVLVRETHPGVASLPTRRACLHRTLTSRVGHHRRGHRCDDWRWGGESIVRREVRREVRHRRVRKVSVPSLLAVWLLLCSPRRRERACACRVRGHVVLGLLAIDLADEGDCVRVTVLPAEQRGVLQQHRLLRVHVMAVRRERLSSDLPIEETRRVALAVRLPHVLCHLRRFGARLSLLCCCCSVTAATAAERTFPSQSGGTPSSRDCARKGCGGVGSVGSPPRCCQRRRVDGCGRRR
jgi:hypothetical protein